MHAGGESDGCVVPTKRPNKGGTTAGGGGGGKATDQGEHEQATASRTQSRIGELSGLLGVREAARKDKRTRFTALLHHVTVDLLRDSFYALKRDAAPGVDGVTWQEYETGLEDEAGRPASPDPSGDVSGAAVQASLHPESRWTATPAWASRPWRTRSSSRPW